MPSSICLFRLSMLLLPNFSDASSPVRSGLLGSHGLPHHTALARLAGLGGRDARRATGKSPARCSHGLAARRFRGLAIWHRRSCRPWRSHPVAIRPCRNRRHCHHSPGRACLNRPPTLPARPHARRTHFSRHDYQPFFANTPRNLSRLSGVTARTHVPRNDFSNRHRCPLGDVAVALSACHIAQQSSSLSCLPGPKRKNPQKRMTLCGFLIRVHLSR